MTNEEVKDYVYKKLLDKRYLVVCKDYITIEVTSNDHFIYIKVKVYSWDVNYTVPNDKIKDWYLNEPIDKLTSLLWYKFQNPTFEDIKLLSDEGYLKHFYIKYFSSIHPSIRKDTKANVMFYMRIV